MVCQLLACFQAVTCQGCEEDYPDCSFSGLLLEVAVLQLQQSVFGSQLPTLSARTKVC